MMTQRLGLYINNVLRPTPGDPWGVEHNTTWTLGQKKTNIWTPVGQATEKKISGISEPSLSVTPD